MIGDRVVKISLVVARTNSVHPKQRRVITSVDDPLEMNQLVDKPT